MAYYLQQGEGDDALTRRNAERAVFDQFLDEARSASHVAEINIAAGIARDELFKFETSRRRRWTIAEIVLLTPVVLELLAGCAPT